MKQVMSMLIKRNNWLTLNSTVSDASSHVDRHDCLQRTSAMYS